MKVRVQFESGNRVGPGLCRLRGDALSPKQLPALQPILPLLSRPLSCPVPYRPLPKPQPPCPHERVFRQALHLWNGAFAASSRSLLAPARAFATTQLLDLNLSLPSPNPPFNLILALQHDQQADSLFCLFLCLSLRWGPLPPSLFGRRRARNLLPNDCSMTALSSALPTLLLSPALLSPVSST